MNNRYICKAKRKDNNEWVTGYYVCAELLDNSGYEHLIIEQSANGSSHKVIPETVCRCTELKDKNGKWIFEGDVVTYKDGEVDYEGYHDSVFLNRGEVGMSAWDGTYFTNRQTVDMDDLYKGETMVDCEIIGNIHDNPELLEAE